MNCPCCFGLHHPTSSYEEIAISIPRHGTLYRCKLCGGFFEVIAEERSPRKTPMDILSEFYPNMTTLATSTKALRENDCTP